MERHTLLQTGLATPSARADAPIRSWTVHISAGDEVAKQAGLGSRPVILGAGADCDIVLEDPQASRRHIELTAAADGVQIRDLGSTNGTFWQGSRITEVIVPSGAQITIGNTTLRITGGEVAAVPPSKRSRFGGLVGQSVAMRELFAVLELASPTDATMVIEGESGTGKELVARAIHDHSRRTNVDLVVVDCSALSEQLIDSHLFGHVKGAFTGATHDRKGAFVEASGGTLFLDELGELPLASQARLLRALEDQTVQPLGSDKRVHVDTRVIAATHRNLAKMVHDEKFRFDLFFRLAVVHAKVPALRERLDDIPHLVRYFYEGRGVVPGPIDGQNLEVLASYSWPGNVRELRNVLERAWALSQPDAKFSDLRIMLGQLGAQPATGRTETIDVTLPFKEAKEQWVDSFERRYLASVYQRFDGNITHCSDHSGINRRHFRKLLLKHGIIES